jgi:hypothetical protein
MSCPPPKPEDLRLAMLVYLGVGLMLLGLLIFEGVTVRGRTCGWVGAILRPIVIYRSGVALGLMALFVILAPRVVSDAEGSGCGEKPGNA